MHTNQEIKSRRKFLRNTGIGAMGLLAGGMFGLPTVLNDNSSRFNKKIVTRKNIASLDFSDPSVKILRDAVDVMKKRSLKSPLDPTGWTAHASHHAIFCATNEYINQVHYNWYLLPWHRGYLYSLELKMQEAVREPKLALHYWDWTKHPQIPVHYWGEDNPMYNGSRLVLPTDVIPFDFINIGATLRATSFYTFGGHPPVKTPDEQQRDGIAEQSFHNNIHNWIGGDMASFDNSGNDMVFNGHHGNLDRIWEAWLAYNTGNKNPEDEAWLEHTFYYTDGKGKPLDLKVKDLLDTEGLGYRFDTLDLNPIFCNPFTDEMCPVAGDQKPDATVHLPLNEKHRSIFKHSPPGKRHRAFIAFERMELPHMPYCARLFFQYSSGAMVGAAEVNKYISTFTVLPIGKPYAGILQKDVYIEIEIDDVTARAIAGKNDIRITLIPVQLRGRSIPHTDIHLKTARLTVTS